MRASTGTILLVPRPNREVRMYIPVESGSVLSNPKNLTFERIMEAARKIIAPYSLEVGSCSWWSAYRVGQRVGERFSVKNRVFLVGDAVRMCLPCFLSPSLNSRTDLIRYPFPKGGPRHEYQHPRRLQSWMETSPRA